MGKGLHKVFKAVVNELKNEFPTLGESGSEVSQFIPEPSNFAEITRLPADVKNAWLKETMKEIKNVINNQTFIMDDPYKGEPVTPCFIHPTGCLTIKCKENHGANFFSTTTLFFLTLSIFLLLRIFYQLVGKNKISGKYQVEPFQKFDRVHILEVSTVIFFSDNEGTTAKAEYGNGG